jgi:hypothetical protein
VVALIDGFLFGVMLSETLKLFFLIGVFS